MTDIPRRGLGRLLTIGLTAVCLALSGCGSAGDSGGGSRESLRVGSFFGNMVDLPAMVADKMGYFADEGLDVTFTDFASAPDGMAAVLGGSIDVAPNNTLTQLVAAKKATGSNKLSQVWPIQMIGNWQLVGRDIDASQDLKSKLASLKGRTIGVPAIGSNGQAAAEMMLEYAGLNPGKDVTFLAVGLGPQALSAFSSKRIDAVMGTQPITSLFTDQGAQIIYDIGSQTEIPGLSPFHMSSYTTTLKRADEKASALEKMSRALDRALEYIRDPKNEDSVADIWSAKLSTVSKAGLKQVVKVYGRTLTGRFDCQALANQANLGVKVGQLTAADVPDCQAMVWPGAKSYIAK
ncbi:ABC transporter substrate-binding protein [Dactylosporangium roseum]|uniref:ABC transporter substrate-binding protein n=1 Tax=Dactylosporangium roseum TaxID=47989 RepID=A0ABY5YXJ8_9ACTN|nr:ABC transporter substrate-binding protein [Dactylosporangium roseum]UWZ34475.1 ABC transporter substrate-binding protein [Dactylosporangium roseum]